jgi:GNAT superfamily N-acetyltransferase
MCLGEISLRTASAADAPCLGALASQVFLETYATSGIRLALAREVESQFSVSAVRSRLAERSHRTVLAERAGHLIGFAEVVVGTRHALVPAIHAAELVRLYVQSPFLRQGVGRLLLQRSEALAYAEAASTLWLTAWVGNERALSFYASQGYEQLGSAVYAFEGEAFENRLFAKALRAET